jgi:hypothetical protein
MMASRTWRIELRQRRIKNRRQAKNEIWQGRHQDDIAPRIGASTRPAPYAGIAIDLRREMAMAIERVLRETLSDEPSEAKVAA